MEFLHAASHSLSGALALAKGMRQPTLPLKATFTPIKGVSLPRSHHSVSVIKGRAYIFGGLDASGQFADNAMHVVNLPSDLMAADYQSIPARPTKKDDGGDGAGAVPGKRKDHTAVVVGDQIYVFGGELEDGEEEAPGRLWVFNSYNNTWSHVDPKPDSDFPPLRTGHASAGSDEPQAEIKPPKADVLPQQPPDPAKYLSEPPEPGSWGTVFISGGRDLEGKVLDDAWVFDVRSKTWFNLPSPPGGGRVAASLIVAGERLYRFGGKSEKGGQEAKGIDFLEVGALWKFGLRGSAFGDLAKSSLMGDWVTSTPQHHPGTRAEPGLVDVTTGQGRGYLLMIGGERAEQSFSDEVWAYQLPPTKATAASIKDSAKSAMKDDTHEGQWAEVVYQYLNDEGDVVQEQKAGSPAAKGVGSRGHFAYAKGTEVDGATAVVWGGVRGEGKVLEDGWMIHLDR